MCSRSKKPPNEADASDVADVADGADVVADEDDVLYEAEEADEDGAAIVCS